MVVPTNALSPLLSSQQEMVLSLTHWSKNQSIITRKESGAKKRSWMVAIFFSNFTSMIDYFDNGFE